MDSNPDSDESISPCHKLIPDLLIKIHSFLDSPIDRLRFRSVCKLWRSSITKHSLSPNPHLYNIRIPSHGRRRLIVSSLILSQSEIYYLFDPSGRSFVSSVIAVEEGKNGKMTAWHPMADKKVSDYRKVLDLTKLGVVQVGKLIHLKRWSRDGSNVFYCRRVVASLSDYNVAENSDDQILSLERFGNVCVVGMFHEKLMCYRFGNGKEWTRITHGGPSFPYSDAIYWKGRFYAVDEARRLVVIDNSMNVDYVVNSPDVLSAGLMWNSGTSYLVDVCGKLHLVVLHYNEDNE